PSAEFQPYDGFAGFSMLRAQVDCAPNDTMRVGPLIEKIGAGTLIVTTSMTSGARITAGTLQIGNGGTTGSITGTVQNFGTLAFNRSDATSYSGAMSGSGTLAKSGGGTLTISGANTYTGGTTITGGRVNFTALNNFGTSNITLNGGGIQWAAGSTVDVSARLAPLGAAGGTLDINLNTVTLASAITGTGALTKMSNVTLTLTGTNSFTGATIISAGVLQLGNGGTTGSVAGVIVNNAELGIRRSDNVILDNAISGTGLIMHLGAGKLTLAGTNSYTGGTSIAS
ncbi:MAG: autotransporter-associated beta strand repeat-containing protein, partial [Pseudomonadota bacterium]